MYYIVVKEKALIVWNAKVNMMSPSKDTLSSEYHPSLWTGTQFIVGAGWIGEFPNFHVIETLSSFMYFVPVQELEGPSENPFLMGQFTWPLKTSVSSSAN